MAKASACSSPGMPQCAGVYKPLIINSAAGRLLLENFWRILSSSSYLLSATPGLTDFQNRPIRASDERATKTVLSFLWIRKVGQMAAIPRDDEEDKERERGVSEGERDEEEGEEDWWAPTGHKGMVGKGLSPGRDVRFWWFGDVFASVYLFLFSFFFLFSLFIFSFQVAGDRGTPP